MRKSSSGFTIVELLIVIVVIAILATISIVAYNGIRTRAQATAIVSDLKATEKALNAYKVGNGTSSWWVDSDPALISGGGGNPSINDIITQQSQFRNFLQKAPTTAGLGTADAWFYDHDNDVYDGCSASLSGVNIALSNITSTALAQAIDTAIDDGNLSCGKLRTSGSYLLYALANKAS